MINIHQNHTFHLVSISPWPIILSFSLFNNLISLIIWFNNINYLIYISIPCTLLCIYQWWRDVIRESTFQGLHTIIIIKILRIGIILFIISEIFFFISFF